MVRRLAQAATVREVIVLTAIVPVAEAVVDAGDALVAAVVTVDAAVVAEAEDVIAVVGDRAGEGTSPAQGFVRVFLLRPQQPGIGSGVGAAEAIAGEHQHAICDRVVGTESGVTILRSCGGIDLGPG